jgi:hypothetical protein
LEVFFRYGSGKELNDFEMNGKNGAFPIGWGFPLAFAASVLTGES